jgi:hypothetical protein
MEAKRSVVSKVFYSANDYDAVKAWLLDGDWTALREYHSTKVWPEFKEMSSGITVDETSTTSVVVS